MDQFKLIDECEFDTIVDDITQDINTNDNNYKLCINCNRYMNIDINNMYICIECGYIKHMITENNNYETSTTNYNTNNTFYMPIKCVGPLSHTIQKCIRNNTSEYRIIQENNIKNKILHFNYNCDKINIPHNFITAAIDQYKKIRNNKRVYRGDILNGIICGLIYYECLKESNAVNPKDIANWAGISETNMSKGDKIIKILQGDGIITLHENENMDYDFIKSYLIKLNIDQRYLPFLYELLQTINMYKLCNINSRIITKTAGLMYLIVRCENLNVAADEIVNECVICASTFKTYYTNLLKHKDIITPVFEKYEMSFPKTTRKARQTKK